MKENLSFHKKDSVLLILFFLLTLFFYHNTLHARFTYDFVTWINRYNEGLHGVVKYFSTDGMLPVYHLVVFTLYKLFGLHGKVWLLICTFWHSLNAFLLFILFRKMLTSIGAANAYKWSAISSLLFLLSPFQTEVVVWGAAIQYLVIGTFLPGIILLTINYTQSKNKTLLFLIPLLFFLSLFTHEAALVIPVIILIIIWFSPAMLINTTNRKILSLSIIVPLMAILILYFLINKIIIGIYFGHYGGSPIQWIEATKITGNYIKYFLKFVFFLPFWGFTIRDNVYSLIELSFFDWIAFTALVLITLLLLVRHSKFSDRGKLLFLLFLLFLVALLPFSTLPYRPIFAICNERHAYLASMFFYPLLVLLAVELLNKYKYVIISIYLVISVFFLHRLTGYWAKAGIVQESLVNDFRWYDKNNIYILSNPNRFQGAWMFESYGDTFGDAIKVYTGKDIRLRVKEVTQFNMVGLMDSVSVSRKSDSTLSIWATVPGTWLWHRGVGLTTYETDDYKVTAGDLNCDFTLKRKLPNSVYIYSVGGKWKEAKF